MTREEKCKLAIERGYTYNPETGLIYSRFKKIISSKQTSGYYTIRIRFNYKIYVILSHHFAWYCIYGNCDIEQIDHINGIRIDNRICNLRNVTHQQNQLNRTTAKGYSWNKLTKKWRADITINKKPIYLGSFNTEEEAREAYLKAKQQYHVI